MSTLFGMRKVLFAVPVLAALATAAPMALPSSDSDVTDTPDLVAAAANCTYYSNASHTTIVGRFGHDCCNNPVSWGKKSQFSECGGCFPCTPPPP